MINAPGAVALVLAAGSSARFGSTDKMMADLGGKPLILHTLDALSNFAFDDRLVVTRPDASALQSICRNRGFAIIENCDAASGMGSSVSLGIRNIHSAERCLIILADTPFVGRNHIAALLASTSETTVTSVGDRKQPPAVFHRSHFRQLAQVRGDRGAHALARISPAIELEPLRSLDIDTHDDLALARELQRQQSFSV